MTIKISKRVEQIIKTSSPREKAVFMVQNVLEPSQLRRDPSITSAESKAIVTTFSPEEGEEYNKWLRFYYVYAEMTPTISLAIDQYSSTVNQAASYIFLLDSYKQEENHLNEIFLSLKEAGNEEALKAFEDSLSLIRFKHQAKIERDEAGFVEVDTKELSNRIAGFTSSIETTSGIMKTLIQSLDEWAEKTKSADLMPSILSIQISRAKEDKLTDVGPLYYRSTLQDRISKGYKATEEEITAAILPYYREIEVSDWFLNDCRSKIKGIDEQIKL